MDKRNNVPWTSTRTKKPLVVSRSGTHISSQSELKASEVEKDEDDVEAAKLEQQCEESDDDNEEGVQIITQPGEQQIFTIDTSSSSGAKSLSGNGETEQNVLHVINSPLRPDHGIMIEYVQRGEQAENGLHQLFHNDNGEECSRSKTESDQNDDSKEMTIRSLNKFPFLRLGIREDDNVKQDSADVGIFHEVVDLTETEKDEERSSERAKDGEKLFSRGRSAPLLEGVVETRDHSPSNEEKESSTENMDIFEYSREYVTGLLQEAIEGERNSSFERRVHVTGGSRNGAESVGKRVMVTGRVAHGSNTVPKRRRLNSSQTQFAVGDNLKFEDIGRTVVEGVIEKKSQKKVLTIEFEDNSRADLVLDSETFYVFGKAVKRLMREKILTRDDIVTETLSCTRGSSKRIDEDSMMKVLGSAQLAEIIEMNDCVFVGCRSRNRFFAGRVLLTEDRECLFVRVLREDRRKWVAPRAIRRPCAEVIELD